MQDKCLIWGTPAQVKHIFDSGSDRVNSPRAGGWYTITREAKEDYAEYPSRFDDQIKARVTTWLIDQRRLGVECPEVTEAVIEAEKRRRPLSVQERADGLLIFIRDQTPSIGKHFCCAERYLNKPAQSWLEDETFSQMKAWSESIDTDDVWYLVQFLEQRNFIYPHDIIPISEKENYREYLITPDGYSHIAELETKSVDSTQAFVAMWFNPLMNDVYEKGIEPGIHDAGYEPVRIDRKDHNNKIDDEIIAEIRRSRFVVADFTHGENGMRGGVYYEAGFARGLGLEVISTCRQDLLENNGIHFDTRQFNHIGWTNDKLDDFREAPRSAMAL